MANTTRTPVRARRHDSSDDLTPRRQVRPAPRRQTTRRAVVAAALAEG